MSAPAPGRVSRRMQLAIALMAIVVYLPSIFNGFAYDDVAVVQNDGRIHTLTNLARIFAQPYWADRGTEFAIYRPLTSASFAIDWFVSRGYPMWFHIVNVLWHAGSCVLLLLVLAELFPPVAALGGALLFALHPAHVEAVANVVGRAEVMSAAFAFAAALLWMRSGARLGVRTAVAVAALYALAMLAKESAVTLPALLVLLDAARGEWRVGSSSAAAYLRRRAPALALLGVALAGELAARYAVIGRMGPAVVDPIFDVASSGPDRVRTALSAWPIFLRILFFPRVLLADYAPRISLPALHWTAGAIAGAALLAGCVVGGLVALARGRGRTALGFLWFPVAILPVSNLLFPTGIFVAERTLYVPSVALSIGVAGLTALALRAPWGADWRVLAAAATPLMLVLAVRSVVREPEWRDTATIFAALDRDAPEAFRVQWDLARRARRAGNKVDAAAHFARALELWPNRLALVVEAGQNAVELGWRDYAASLAAMAQARWPRDPSVRRLVAAVARGRAERPLRPRTASPGGSRSLGRRADAGRPDAAARRL
ncbi:MAG: hypothetical protein IRZ00_02615 [Gemmatimonadetes bacterium]|nr:hypothetical protein [Gemmatimonadota bacterium]